MGLLCHISCMNTVMIGVLGMVELLETPSEVIICLFAYVYAIIETVLFKQELHEKYKWISICTSMHFKSIKLQAPYWIKCISQILWNKSMIISLIHTGTSWSLLFYILNRWQKSTRILSLLYFLVLLILSMHLFGWLSGKTLLWYLSGSFCIKSLS